MALWHRCRKKEGYDPAFSAAANISSCPSGLLIPPSNTLIVFSLVSGGDFYCSIILGWIYPRDINGIEPNDRCRYYRQT
nr:TRAP transporter large permease subunit [Aeromonas veronii]